MYAFPTFASLALLATRLALVHAAVYVTNPVQSTTCTGGQSCLVQWVDDGQSPLLATIGECQVSLYTGELTLVQSLPSVDVSTTSSFSFTPDPAAGPNGPYYLVFTASSISYQGFSGSFTLTGMSGTTPGGGSSTPVSTLATTSAGSSTSAGSTTPGTSPTNTTTTSSGTSTPVVGTTTPTSSTSAIDTATATGTTPSTTPILTTPTVTTTASSVTPTFPTTTTASSASTFASAAATNAAGRVGSSASLGGVAALFVLSGVLAF